MKSSGLSCVPVGKGQRLHERNGIPLSRMGNAGTGADAGNRTACHYAVYRKTAWQGKPDRKDKEQLKAALSLIVYRRYITARGTIADKFI